MARDSAEPTYRTPDGNAHPIEGPSEAVIDAIDQAVESIPDRVTRRMSGLWFGVWDFSPMDVCAIADRFGTVEADVKRRLAVGKAHVRRALQVEA